jgi:hypothetical protein
MSDAPAAPAAPTTPAVPDAPATTTTTEPAEKAEPDWKAEARKHETRSKEWKAKAEQNETAAQRLAELENASKSDLEKAQIAQREAETKAAELEARALRAEVAAEKGVPIDLLTGSTKDEIEAAADRLIEFKGSKAPVGVHLPNQDKTPPATKSDLGETARKIFGGQ